MLGLKVAECTATKSEKISTPMDNFVFGAAITSLALRWITIYIIFFLNVFFSYMFTFWSCYKTKNIMILIIGTTGAIFSCIGRITVYFITKSSSLEPYDPPPYFENDINNLFYLSLF